MESEKTVIALVLLHVSKKATNGRHVTPAGGGGIIWCLCVIRGEQRNCMSQILLTGSNPIVAQIEIETGSDLISWFFVNLGMETPKSFPTHTFMMQNPCACGVDSADLGSQFD